MSEGDVRKDRKPLLEKLEPMHRGSRGRGFHREANEWSKMGRGILQRIMDAIADLWNA